MIGDCTSGMPLQLRIVESEDRPGKSLNLFEDKTAVAGTHAQNGEYQNVVTSIDVY